MHLDTMLVDDQKYNMEISTQNTKLLSFPGKEPIPSKICTDNRKLERINKFTYLDYTLSYQGEVGISTKIQNIQKQCE